MTNNNLTRDLDSITYSLILPDDDRAILRAMLELQRECADYLLAAATRDLDPALPHSIDAEFPLTQYDYSSDDDDYNPAAAHILALITDALCAHIYESPRAAMIALFADDDLLIDLDTLRPNFDLITLTDTDD